MTLLAIIACITCIYALLIISLCIGFNRLPNIEAKHEPQTTSFSIIIPFRNEAENLPHLFNSLKHLEYPNSLFEVILIDDASTDNSLSIAKQFQTENPSLAIHLLENKHLNTGSPKKAAIELGIKHAKHEWIVTTDADCKVPRQWLSLFNSYYRNTDCVFIAAPVTYFSIDSFLKRFQLLDFLSLMGATIGSFGLETPLFCNGANLAYKKSAFLRVNGFSGNTHIASGDDVFLMEKMIAQYPNQIGYIKNNACTVLTAPEATLQKLITQRLRWAAKTKNYTSTHTKTVGLIVFLMNFLLVILGLATLISLSLWKITISCFLIKFLVDALLLYKTASFFKQKHFLKNLLSSSVLYPIFCVYIVLMSQFTSYSWKNRTFKK